MTPLRLIGGRPSTPEERHLALRIAAVFAVPMALVLLIPLVVAFYVYRHETQARLKDDRALIEKVNRERIERTIAINQFVYQQCIEAEIRDVVYAQQARGQLRIISRIPHPSQALKELSIALQDGINALEPPDEPNCEPPSAISPKGSP